MTIPHVPVVSRSSGTVQFSLPDSECTRHVLRCWRKTPKLGQAQPAGPGAIFEALASAKEPTEASGSTSAKLCRHVEVTFSGLRSMRMAMDQRLEPVLTPKADRQGMCLGVNHVDQLRRRGPQL